MTCPVCNVKTKVLESRYDIDHVVRVHRCKSCSYTFRTIEVDEDIYVRIKEGNNTNVKNKQVRNPVP
jgi:transcriptional regulator NrdR family protein